jgi:large subunit ribosomal protein L6
VSRIGRMPITIPNGVDVTIEGSQVLVKGPRGQIARSFPTEMTVQLENGQIVIRRPSDEQRVRALHGMTRALINNMVTGVFTGFQRVLEVNGVGYRAEISGKNLMLYVGYSHPVTVEPPSGISFESDARTRQIKILGYDKEMVGQVAANIRKIRPPEPYKGKGIKYLEETIRRKAGKAGKGK